MKLINELKNGSKIRLNGYHATVLRSSRQMSACKTAVKRILPNMTSNINVDQPRNSNKHTTVIPRTREPVGTQTRQRKWEWQRTITLKKRALKAEESQIKWLSSHSVAIQQADERMSHWSQTKITEHHLKRQRWPTKDFERAYHCNTKTTGRNTNTSNKTGVAKNHQTNKSCSKSRGIWLSGYQATVSRSRNKVPL